MQQQLYKEQDSHSKIKGGGEKRIRRDLGDCQAVAVVLSPKGKAHLDELEEVIEAYSGRQMRFEEEEEREGAGGMPAGHDEMLQDLKANSQVLNSACSPKHWMESQLKQIDETDPSNYVSESLPVIFERLDSESADVSPERKAAQGQRLGDNKNKKLNQSIGIIYSGANKAKFEIKDTNELSMANKRQHRNNQKHRTNRTTTKNIIQMQKKNSRNPFRPANASLSQPHSVKTSRQTSNNSSLANSNYGSKRFAQYNLDVNELYESILQTQRSQLSGKNQKKFNNSQKFANLREVTQNQLLSNANLKDRFKFQLSENEYEQNSLESKKVLEGVSNNDKTFLSSLKTTLNSFLKLNVQDNQSQQVARRRNTSSNNQFSSTEDVLMAKAMHRKHDIRLDSLPQDREDLLQHTVQSQMEQWNKGTCSNKQSKIFQLGQIMKETGQYKIPQRLSGPKSLKNHPAAFKKENRASIKALGSVKGTSSSQNNFMSQDINKRRKDHGSSSQQTKQSTKDRKRDDEENLSSSHSDQDVKSKGQLTVSTSQKDLKQVLNLISAKNCMVISENFDRVSTRQQMDKIEEALIDNGSIISADSSRKKQMSDIFNSTHNFNQLKQIFEDKTIMNRTSSIRASGASNPGAILSPQHAIEMVNKKQNAVNNVNQRQKLNDYIISSPSVKQKDPVAAPVMSFQKQDLDEQMEQQLELIKQASSLEYQKELTDKIGTPQIAKKSLNQVIGGCKTDPVRQMSERRLTINSEPFANKMSKFDINEQQLMNPFTHESKSSVKKLEGDLMLLKMNTSSNEELIELNILRSSARLNNNNLRNMDLVASNAKRMHDSQDNTDKKNNTNHHNKTNSDAHDQTFESLHQSQKLRKVEISKQGDGDETPPRSSVEEDQFDDNVNFVVEAREAEAEGAGGSSQMQLTNHLLNIGSQNEGALPAGNVRKSTSFKNYIVSGIQKRSKSVNLINYIGIDKPVYLQQELGKSKSSNELKSQSVLQRNKSNQFAQNSSGELTQSNIGLDANGKTFNIRLTDLILEHENFTTFRQAIDQPKNKNQQEALQNGDNDECLSPSIKFILKNSIFDKQKQHDEAEFGNLDLENQGESGGGHTTTPNAMQGSGHNTTIGAQNYHRSQIDINFEKDNLISRLRELEAEELEQEDAVAAGDRSSSGWNKQNKAKNTSAKDNAARKKDQKGSTRGGMSTRQKNLIIAILKGYKVRKVFRFDPEVISYMKEIKALEDDLKDTSKLNWTEINHTLKMKKHLLHHTMKQKIKLKKTKSRTHGGSKQIHNSQLSANNISLSELQMAIQSNQLDENQLNAVLMHRYLKNQKNNSVQIAFGQLFDSSSRFKVLAKKPEIMEQNNGEYFSNLSFQKQITIQESTDSKIRASARSSIDQLRVGSILHQNSSSFESSSQNSINESDKFYQKSLFNDLRTSNTQNNAHTQLHQDEFAFKNSAYRAQPLRESHGSTQSNGDELLGLQSQTENLDPGSKEIDDLFLVDYQNDLGSIQQTLQKIKQARKATCDDKDSSSIESTSLQSPARQSMLQSDIALNLHSMSQNHQLLLHDQLVQDNQQVLFEVQLQPTEETENSEDQIDLNTELLTETHAQSSLLCPNIMKQLPDNGVDSALDALVVGQRRREEAKVGYK